MKDNDSLFTQTYYIDTFPLISPKHPQPNIIRALTLPWLGTTNYQVWWLVTNQHH